MERALGWMGVFGAGLAIVAVLALDATLGGQHTRGRQLRSATISEYVYTSGSMAFVVAVLVLAVASVALLHGLIRAGRVRLRSAGSVLMMLWVVGLLGVVAFPKHNWVTGPSASGTVHRVATLLAFVALPMAVLLIARGSDIAVRAARWLTAIGIGWLAVLFGAIAVGVATDRSWWRLIPLGVVERGIAGFEVAALIALGLWLVRGGRADPAHERKASSRRERHIPATSEPRVPAGRSGPPQDPDPHDPASAP
ncbi:DUF998 domain-containing protein [Mycolicibacterium aichiense]|uniref:DUF998 domain-containing protein n=1 Tax=Mycolicibacterium aichiense TaxID=1799 RepID=A0AAD1HL71_9MYCO|nr:DUF998 domain-containing protein [Mycolicibacterium aichiense]MCV7018047.1 DUF998 domain-containing protein [Mycolicibacterium aichiense]BBX06231.1 hypothetical protein MAIC_10340 [Mycolicibacterium aichiense]STZ24429.1 Uncharacterised protein [Mycolicibacterium aichiense]